MIEWISAKNIDYWNPSMGYNEETDLEDDEGIPEFIRVTDELDLHGTNPGIIPEMIDEFVSNAILLGLKRLRIVHGKGRSKLKYITRKTLAANKFVQAYGDAPPDNGGWGATIVVLK
jgi:dsDNA-specific endonuclease/ATPase MutS2